MPFFFIEPLRLALQCNQVACQQCQLMFLAPWLLWAPTTKRETDER